MERRAYCRPEASRSSCGVNGCFVSREVKTHGEGAHTGLSWTGIQPVLTDHWSPWSGDSVRAVRGDRPISFRGGHPPDCVAYIVCDEQCTSSVHGHANRTPERVAVRIDEAGQDISRFCGGTAIRKRHEDHFVAAARLAVP